MTAHNIDIIPATPELLERFYGKPPVRTVNAVVAVREGEILGIAGVYLDLGRLVLFSELTDELRKHKRVIVKGIGKVKEIVQNTRLPVVSLADCSIKGSDTLLAHMGFREEDGLWHI